MPTALKPVLPFYNNNSATALPDDIELFSGAHHPTTLLAEEVLSPAGLDAVTSPVKITIISMLSEGPHQPYSCCPTPMPTLEFHLAPKSQHGATTPYPRKVGFQQATSVSTEQTRDSMGDLLSETSSDDESTLSTLSDDSKIPKPQGEPGHPSHGGYTLETALNWNHKAYVKFKVRFVFVRTATLHNLT